MAAPSDIDVDQAILDYEERQEKEQKKSSTFLGRLTQIPCFRESFMYGIMSGLGTGLGTFMLTSRARRACDVGMGTYAAVTFCWWFYCRYERTRMHREMQRVQYMIFDENQPETVESAIVVLPKTRTAS